MEDTFIEAARHFNPEAGPWRIHFKVQPDTSTPRYTMEDTL
jgi:hypothetical protein